MKRLLLSCGVLVALLYIGMMQLIRYDGYNWVSQVVSELSAVGAPTRPLWFWLGWVYTALVLAFGWGVWKSAGANRSLRIVGGMILFSGLLGFVWPFAPMHQREVVAAGGGNMSDVLHIALSVVTVPVFLLTVGFGAVALGKRFRVYSIATAVIALAAGLVTAVQAPGVSANLPTPTIGLWERINIGVYMLWLGVLAIALLRRKETAAPAAPRPALTGTAV